MKRKQFRCANCREDIWGDAFSYAACSRGMGRHPLCPNCWDLDYCPGCRKSGLYAEMERARIRQANTPPQPVPEGMYIHYYPPRPPDVDDEC